MTVPAVLRGAVQQRLRQVTELRAGAVVVAGALRLAEHLLQLLEQACGEVVAHTPYVSVDAGPYSPPKL